MLIISALLAIALAIIPQTVFAEEVKSGVHMQLSPISERVSLEPGDTYRGTFLLRNIGESDFNYTIGVTPYQAADNDYNPDYVTKNNYTKIVDWITFEEDNGFLSPGKSVKINYTITVPEDVPAGGQYAMITASTSDGNIEGSSVRTISRLGMIIYATVAGVTRITGDILDANIQGIIFNAPLYATSTVVNTGNVDAEVTYSLEVRDFFSKDVVYSTAVATATADNDPVTKVVLPESTRTNVVSWDGSPKLGLFEAEQTVEFLGKISTVKKVVFLCPAWLLIVFVFFIALCIAWVVMKIRARIEQARSGKFGL